MFKNVIIVFLVMSYNLQALEHAIKQQKIFNKKVNSGLTADEEQLSADELLDEAANCIDNDLNNGYRILKVVEETNKRQASRIDLIYGQLYYNNKLYSDAYKKFKNVVLNQLSTKEDYAQACIYLGDIFALGQYVAQSDELAICSYEMVLSIDLTNNVNIQAYKDIAQKKIDKIKTNSSNS
ncbi:MAG: hypothetical protein P4L22_03690 [Candidatus Babeliales bacterium]|nr:hypothetical protein [Candidatus Babeliales bacterium]